MKSNNIFKKILLLAGFSGLLSFSSFAQFQQNPIVTPEIQENGSLTFRLMAPSADSVKISGSWMQGWGSAEHLSKNEDGLW